MKGIMNKRDKIVACIIYAAIIYILAANYAYRFRHPELTETQLILKSPYWLRWR